MTSSTILLETFDDGILNGGNWSYHSTGGEHLGSNVRETNGHLDIRNSQTDNGGKARYIFDTPLASTNINFDTFYHSDPSLYFNGGNNFYFGKTRLFFENEVGEEFQFLLSFMRSDYGPDYQNDPLNYNHPRLSLGDLAGSTLTTFAPTVTSSNNYDQWINQNISFDNVVGTIAVDLDGDGLTDASIGNTSLINASFTKIEFDSYGWWTGHYRLLDNLKIDNTSPIKTAAEIWGGESRVHFVNFAEAAYGAQSGTEAHDFLTIAGWKIFTAATENDFFDLSEVDGGIFDGGYSFKNDGTIISEGTFGLLGNSALMIARSQDALVISFRGTDDWQDAVDWGHLSSHFAELEPLLESINQFVENSSEINKVYVTGHSLGAAMAQQYYVKYSEVGFANITGINFASPGYEDNVFDALSNLVLGGGLFTSMIDLLQYYGANFDTYWNDGDIIQNAAAFQTTIGEKHLIKFSEFSQLGSSFDSMFSKHSMELYRDALSFIAYQWAQSDASSLMTVDKMLDAYEGYYIQADYDGSQESWTVGNRIGTDAFYGDWELFSNPNEAFFGSGADDLIKGKDGNDLLHGGGGNDRLFGGDDSDIIIGGSGIDTVTYQSGVFVVTVNLQTGRGYGGEAAGDRIYEVENVIGTGLGGLLFGDTLWGNNENNVIDGLGGKDNLKGFSGNDTLFGRTGNDKLEGGIGADILDGGAGHDTALYTSSTSGVSIYLTGFNPSTGGEAEGDTLNSIEHVEGSNHSDTLVGSFTTANHLFGNAGDDFLSGLSGNDRLYGGAGQDRLFAGDGFDILKGGIDADHFVFDNDDDLNFIRDFQRPIDKIQILDGVSFDGAVAEWKLWGGTKIELGVDDIYISTKLWGTKITYGDTTISLIGVYGTIDETHFIPDDMSGVGL